MASQVVADRSRGVRALIEALADRVHEGAEASAANAGLRVYRTRGLFGLRINRQYVHPMMEGRR